MAEASFLDPKMLLGLGTFAFFFGVILLTIFKKINLPIQTVLFVCTIIIFGIGFLFRLFFSEEGTIGALLLPNEMLRGVILHPITAMLAGFFLAGALQASGGFDALRVILDKLRKSPLGLAGTLVIICHLPLLVQLPCGRIIAAALLPLLFSFGHQGMNLLTKSQLIIFIGAFSRSAWGTCGPSPIGGVAQMGEGFLGAHFVTASNGILRAPQSLSLMLGTGFMALFLKLITMKMYPKGTSLTEKKEDAADADTAGVPKGAPLSGYISLVIFVLALVFALFQGPIQFALRDYLPFPKMPVQTVLVAGSLLILLLTRVRVDDLMGGIILLPAASMAGGFMAAGALEATYGFAALAFLMEKIQQFPLLGIAGMMAIYVQLQAVVALACSRILYAALVPVLYYLGPAGKGLLTWEQLAIMLAAYSINAAAGCAQSPAGGCGMMSEGAIRAETGYLSGAFSLTGMAILMPLAAIAMKFQTLHYFDASAPASMAMLFGLTTVVIVVNGFVFKLVGERLGDDCDENWWVLFWGYLALTIFASIVFGYCMFGPGIGQLLQAAFGGAVISVVAMVLLAPRCLEA